MDTFIHQSQTPPLTVLSTDQARQGVTGHNVRWVLAWGLASAVVDQGRQPLLAERCREGELLN